MGRQIKFSKQELIDCTTAGCDGCEIYFLVII